MLKNNIDPQPGDQPEKGNPPNQPDKNTPTRPDQNPDPTRKKEGVNEPEKVDPTRIPEKPKTDSAISHNVSFYSRIMALDKWIKNG